VKSKKQKAKKEPISRAEGRCEEEAQSGQTAAAGRNVHVIKSNELKRKFQEALLDSQINDSKLSPTSAMYPVSIW